MVESLRIRLYLDHNIDLDLAFDLRQLGFDAVAAKEVGHERATDPFPLAWATAHRRTMLTSDLTDFPALAETYFYRGEDHAGIILALQPPDLPYGQLLRRLRRLLETLTAAEMINRVEWLDSRWSDR